MQIEIWQLVQNVIFAHIIQSKMGFETGCIGFVGGVFIDLFLFGIEWIITGKIGPVSVARFYTRLQIGIIIVMTIIGLMEQN